MLFRKKPLLSVIVVAFEMSRALPRTLQSLQAGYQRNIREDQYEVIVVDNGSKNPLPETTIRSFGKTFRYHIIREPKPSPADAVNQGAALARGRLLLIMIDGARMLTPGFLHHTLAAFRMYPNAIVASPAWHLGKDNQQISIQQGYDEAEEDALLRQIGWPGDGYRLFEIGSVAPNSRDGFLRPLGECNALAIRASLFRRLGGYDTRFESTGGGLVNHEFYHRVLESPDTVLVILPGEGNFHQIHGGIATNASPDTLRKRFAAWQEEYQRITRKPFAKVNRPAVVLGHIHPCAYPYLRFSLDAVSREQ